MTDFHEIIRNLQSELEETRQQLKRKEKQVQSLKKTNKIQEAHVELQRKKIADLENKKPSQVIEDDSQKVQELIGNIDKLNKEVDSLRQANMLLNNQLSSERRISSQLNDKLRSYENQDKSVSDRFKVQKQKCESGLKQGEKKIAALEAQVARGKKRISELQKELHQRQKSEAGIKQGEKKIISLEAQLSKGKKKIAELQKELKNASNSSKSQKVVIQAPVISASPAILFASLGQSLSESQIGLPRNNEHFFQLYDSYLTNLMPNQKIRFLNIISADAENRLEMINDQLELLADME